MGMNQNIYDALIEDKVFDFSSRKKVIILGEQFTDCKEYPRRIYVKDVLRQEGWSVDSIDMGKEYPTSLKIDLAEPIPNSMKNKFDLLLDFGTGEHVRDQKIYWENCHELLKTGGKRIHALPLVNTWPKHCVYRYRMEFFEQLCSLFDYNVNCIKKIGSGNKTLIYSNFNKGEGKYSRTLFEKDLEKEIEAEVSFKDKEMFGAK